MKILTLAITTSTLFLSLNAHASGAKLDPSLDQNALVAHSVVYDDRTRSPGYLAPDVSYSFVLKSSCSETLHDSNQSYQNDYYGLNCLPVKEPFCTSWIQPVVTNIKTNGYNSVTMRDAVNAQFRSLSKDKNDLFGGLYIASAFIDTSVDMVYLPRMMWEFNQLLLNIPNTIISEIEGGINSIRQGFADAAARDQEVAFGQLLRMSALVNGLILANQRCSDLDTDHTTLLNQTVETFQAELRGELKDLVLKTK